MHTHMYAHTHKIHVHTPLCANYLSSASIWLGCTACSPWARPGDIQAQINTRQLLGARDILVINSCTTETPPTPTIPPEHAVSFQISVCQAEAGRDQTRFSAKGTGGKPGEEEPLPKIPSLQQHLHPQLQKCDCLVRGFLNP